MRKSYPLASVTAVAVAFFASAAVLNAQEPTPAAPDQAACTLSLAPQNAPIQAEPFQLKGVLSQSVGATPVVTVQEQESGLEVAVAPSVESPDVNKSAPQEPATPAPSTQPAPAPSTQPAPATPASPAPAAQPDAAASQTINLMLNTSAAKAGEWTISVKGENGTCTGKIKVEAANPSGSN